MSQIIKVLTVDDNKINNRLIFECLKKNYQVDIAESGQEALNILTENDYDIVILDVNMPNIDGYQVCSMLRKSQRNNMIPVIFASDLTALEDKLKGYAAGGNDYIEKPIKVEELIQKIEGEVTQSRKISSLNQQVQLATQTAMTAMTNNSELGVIISFMELSFQTNEIHSLSKILVESISQYQVVCCAQIRVNQETVNICSTHCEVSHLEKDLLNKGRDASRIVTLGKRGLFNSRRVSILIRDLPIDNEQKLGRLVDHLAAIVVAADARCKHIELQQHKQGTRNKALDSVVEIADEEIEKIQEQFTHFRAETSRIMSELHNDIEESLFDLTLTTSQEDHLYRLLEQGKREMSDLSDWGIVVENSLAKIKTTVTKAIESE